jgi:guanylate kinase
VRMKNHIHHFLSLLDAGGETGKKLDFLLQEMNREANTLMSKTTGVTGEALRVTELGLAVFIISAPSGSGKSTLTNELRHIVPNLEFSISYTTRPPRGSEQSGHEYFFITRNEFERMIREDEFLEQAEVFGNYYGTAKRFLGEATARGHDLLLDIDVQGAAQVKCKVPDAVSIFVLPPSREELERRLRRRAEADDNLQKQLMGDGARLFNTEAIIQRRLQTASHEIENFAQYDYILVNDRLGESIDTLKSIVEAERLKRSGTTFTPKDEAVLAVASQARRDNMMPQIETILATFDLSGLPTVTE